jgi:four helix bundle protein
MVTPQTFEDTEAWKGARVLTQRVYALCRREPLSRDFGLCDQLRRAAVSVMNNLAEGWETIHLAEKKQAYNYARRSCGEVRSMTYVMLDNQFITASEQPDLLTHCKQTGKLITGLIHSIDRR